METQTKRMKTMTRVTGENRKNAQTWESAWKQAWEHDEASNRRKPEACDDYLGKG